MRFKRLVCALAALSLHGAEPARAVDPGFAYFYNNEFDQALSYFEQQIKLHPTNPDLYNDVAQALLYREMLRDGALESQLVTGNNPFLRRAKMEITPEEKSRFFNCVDKATSLSEARLNSNPRDIDALFALGVEHGLRSNYLFLVEKSWVEALREATAARKANEQILEIDPKSVDAHLVLGLNHYIVGSLSFYMRALGFLGGFHGDREGGIHELEMVQHAGVRNRYDAEVLLAAIYRREKDPRKAIPLLKDLAARFPRNHLFRFEEVQMYSDAGDKNSALRVLGEIESLRRSGAPGYSQLPPGKIQYARGNLLFWYNDLPAALVDLKQAVHQAGDLDLSTALLAWLRVGQTYDLQGNHEEAITAYRAAIHLAPKSEPAGEARGYIGNPYHRKPDGGSTK